MDGFLFLKPAAKHLHRNDEQDTGGVISKNTREMPAAVVDLEPADKNNDQRHHGQITAHQDKVLQPATAVIPALPPAFLGYKIQNKGSGFCNIEPERHLYVAHDETIHSKGV